MDFSVGSLFASLLVGGIGFVLFVYGRKQSRMPHLVTGFVLMAYPYFVSDTLLMIGIAALLLALLWYAVRRLGW